MKRKYRKIKGGLKGALKRTTNFNSGCKISVIVAIVIALNLALFVELFGISIFHFINPNWGLDGENSMRSAESIAMEEKIRKMVRGYPMEKMARYISQEDEQVAAFLVSIAKKESNWGRRHPKLNGHDCYNYWGFRQKRGRMGTDGHTCFESPEEAVAVVSQRIEELIRSGINNPADMVVWKCGFSCDAHSDESVSKWINDVSLYYRRFYN